MPTSNRLGLFANRKPQLRRCSNCTGQQATLMVIFLNGLNGVAKSIEVVTLLGQRFWDGIKQANQVIGSEPVSSIPPWPVHQLLP